MRVTDDTTARPRWIELTATDQRADPAVGGDRRQLHRHHRAQAAPSRRWPTRPCTIRSPASPTAACSTERLELAPRPRRAQRHRGSAVLFFDVDHFKLVNDSLGPPGRRRGAAASWPNGSARGPRRRHGGPVRRRRVRRRLRRHRARIEEALEIAERLTALIEEPLDHRSGRAHRHRERRGGAQRGPGDDPASLLRDADAAMNLAKERGRARVEVFSDELRSQATRRLDLDTALRRALDRRELHLVYQPVVGVDDRRAGRAARRCCAGTIPASAPISPAEFIPARRTIRAHRAASARWVIRKAVAPARRVATQRSRTADLWMAVNISARQLGAPDWSPPSPRRWPTPASTRSGCTSRSPRARSIDDVVASIERLGRAQGAGRAHRHRRLRHRLLVALLPQAAPDRHAQDRPVVHRRPRHRPPRHVDRATPSSASGGALDLDLIAEGVETPTQLAELQPSAATAPRASTGASPSPPSSSWPGSPHGGTDRPSGGRAGAAAPTGATPPAAPEAPRPGRRRAG